LKQLGISSFFRLKNTQEHYIVTNLIVTCFKNFFIYSAFQIFKEQLLKKQKFSQPLNFSVKKTKVKSLTTS